jgi:hypothetical protein
MPKSVPIAIVIAGLIIGGANAASTWIQRPRYALVSDSVAIYRIDVHSGQIVTCYPNPSTVGAAKIPGLQTFGVVCLNEQGR